MQNNLGLENKPSILISGLLEWAERDPDRIAIGDNSYSLTFAQLLKRVELLGSKLINQQDFSTRDRVLPVLVDRSAEALIAILSCAYAGIAFSPIDSDQPTERILYLLKRLNCDDLLLSTPNNAHATLPSSIKIVFSDELNESVSKPISVSPDAIALVLFTSGSTGSPKGVVFNWKGFEEGLLNQEKFPGQDLSLIRHGVTGPIYLSGGLVRQLSVAIGISVFILNPTGISQQELLQRVCDLNISLFALPPSIIRSLAQFPDNPRIFLPAVKQLEIGTEGLRYEDLSAISKFFSKDINIFHGLGATEASCKIGNTFKLADAPKTGQVPLGMPVVPGQAWLRPGPDGSSEVLEILFGADLAKEYLDDPELTQQRFVFDDEGRPWWRSGDLVSLDESGRYWHRGRTDDLIKIRGKLASPSEVMQVLSSIDGIKSSIVLPHKSGGATRFVAHIVLDDDSRLTAFQVRRKLALSLPSHLIPALLMLHTELPLNINRKIDRLKLKEEQVIPWRHKPFISPYSSSEISVLNAVKIVLDLDDLSVDDDLWEFGLDSLSAIELVTRLEDSVTKTLTIDDLLRYRTVEQIAKRLKRSFIPPVETIFMNEAGKLPTIFAVPGIGGFAMHFVHLARALGHDQPLTVFPDVSFTARDLSIEAESARISLLVEEIQPDGWICLMGFSAGGIIALEITRHLVSRNRDVNLILIDAGIHRFSLGVESELFQSPTDEISNGVFSLIVRKFATFKSVFSSLGLRRSLLVNWNIFMRQYFKPKYLSVLFLISRGRLPSGMVRFDFLAARKRDLQKNYIAKKVNCEINYFSVKNNPAPYLWRNLFPEMNIVEVAGNHVSMLQPPLVLGLAEEIRKNLDAFRARSESVMPKS